MKKIYPLRSSFSTDSGYFNKNVINHSFTLIQLSNDLFLWSLPFLIIGGFYGSFLRVSSIIFSDRSILHEQGTERKTRIFLALVCQLRYVQLLADHCRNTNCSFCYFHAFSLLG